MFATPHAHISQQHLEHVRPRLQRRFADGELERFEVHARCPLGHLDYAGDFGALRECNNHNKKTAPHQNPLWLRRPGIVRCRSLS